MKIWEAIIYGIIGGLTEVLPVSFSGHAALLRGAFNLSSLNMGAGLYVRAAICLGIALASAIAFRAELFGVRHELVSLRGGKKRKKHASSLRRALFMGAVALAPSLVSFLFTAHAERIERLLYVALFFALNGLLIFFCCRAFSGTKDEKNITLPDAVLVGVFRIPGVFPGLSPISASLTAGRLCGLSDTYNLRLCYGVLTVYQLIAFFYRLIRAIVFGSFAGAVFAMMLIAAALATVFGYLAIQYFRYLLQKQKLGVFSYYCWEAAAICLIVALINA